MPGTIYNFAEEAKRVEEVLRKQFPQDAIDTSEGYNGRVHVKVVSKYFNGKNEAQKQDILWEMLKSELGQGAQAVSLALAYGTDEL